LLYDTLAYTIGLGAAAATKDQVEWFNKSKRFHLVNPDNGSQDLFDGELQRD
jgi:hypothetical protein